MESKSSDDAIGSEFPNGGNSMARHLNSQVGELQRSQASRFDQSRVAAALHDDDPRNETHMTTLIACEDDEIMEDAHSENEEFWASLKNLITETTTSSPYFLDLADYVNEDGNGVLAAPNPTIINGYEKNRDSSQSRNPLEGFPTVDSPFYMLHTSSGGVLNNNYAMDDLTTLTRRYGVYPFIKKTARASIGFAGATADMCFHNHQLYHLLGQHLNGSLLQLTDPTGTDQIADVPMTLTPRKNITLVLDIDGTLIHSSMRDDGADFSFPMLHGEKGHTVYVKKRPYVDAFLKKVAEMFEIVVFTASISPYADQLLDILDPENRMISRRFYRESCLPVDGNYLKDLTIIEADLAKVAIIDNTPEVFRLHVHNGIPIKTWSSDPYDVSLPELIPFLETLAVAEDVRPIIENKFAN